MIKHWILGPCSVESPELFFSVLEKLLPLMKGRSFFYKASFDKANRTSVAGKRGPGLERSLEMFKDAKKRHPDLKLTTDVHELGQIEKLVEVIDVVQIPAFLCRQTDLLVESARHFDVVNIKKGQWMSPDNMVRGLDKIKNTRPKTQAWLTERGSQFGHNQLVVDFSSVNQLREHFDALFLDCTHSTQKLKPNGRMGGDGDLSSGTTASSPKPTPTPGRPFPTGIPRSCSAAWKR
jgi:2-dehydro-3-deoxyphosphooctonate aldolase (KDO 8-P synthase)